MKKIVLIVIFLSGVLSCSNEKLTHCEDFNLMPENNWTKEINNPTNAIISRNAGKEGNGLELILNPNDGLGKKSNKFRSEFYFSHKTDSLLSEKYFKWDFCLPINQKIDDENIGRQIIIAQLHSRPKPGENWDIYKKENPFNRPSIALVLTKEKDGLYLILKYGLNGKPNFNYSEYKWQSVAKKKIQRGLWYEMVFHIKFSHSNQGYISAFINNEYFTPFNGLNNKVYGANMHNSSPNFFKFGLYRYFKNSTKQSIFLDQFKTNINLWDDK